MRSYTHFRLPPLVVPPWPVLAVCHHGQGVALPDRLSHTARSFFTRRPHSWSWTARIHRVSYRPAGRELGHRTSQKTCGFLSGWFPEKIFKQKITTPKGAGRESTTARKRGRKAAPPNRREGKATPPNIFSFLFLAALKTKN